MNVRWGCIFRASRSSAGNSTVAISILPPLHGVRQVMRSLLRTAAAVLCMLGAVSLPASNVSARSYYDDDDVHAPSPACSRSQKLRCDLSPASRSPRRGPRSSTASPIRAFPPGMARSRERLCGLLPRGMRSAGLSSHIALARYVVQWNVMSGAYPAYLSAARSVVPRRALPRPHARDLARRLRRGAAGLLFGISGRSASAAGSIPRPLPMSRSGMSRTTRSALLAECRRPLHAHRAIALPRPRLHRDRRQPPRLPLDERLRAGVRVALSIRRA